MRRKIEEKIKADLKEKMVLLTGPRQVGKTTLSKQLTDTYDYLNFDASKDRKLIFNQEWDRKAGLVVFDELHKMKKWKSWLKGIYDTEGIEPSILVTGSARMDVYRKGGDSLAGRYFQYRLHPFTVNEVAPVMKEKEALTRLMTLGGFPEPFLKNSETAAARWRKSHLDTILREDLLDLEKVRDIKSIEILVELLRERVGSTISCSSIAGDLQVSPHTVKHWLQILEDLYIIFAVRPYHKNISRSLLKEPKYYFYDTGAVHGEKGIRLENTVACCLLAEVHYHEDTTGKKCALHYLRDKDKHEIDFLITVNGKPYQAIEVKLSEQNFSKSIFHFQKHIKEIIFSQIVLNLDRKKTSERAEMVSVYDFLKKFTLEREKDKVWQ